VFIMKFKLSLIAVAACCLFNGCSTAPVVKQDPIDVEVEQKIADAARKIQMAQAQLSQGGAVTLVVFKAPERIASAQSLVSVRWKGDARPLLAKLAKDNGLTLKSSGVSLPLPIIVNAKGEAFASVLSRIRRQIGYRATVDLSADVLILQYNRMPSNMEE